MNPVIIWFVAASVYALFRLWYDNWRGPLRPDEIAQYLEGVEGTATAQMNDIEALRRFLEEDDGREFVMLNLVRLAPEPVAHPTSGEPTRAETLLRGYLGGFMPTLLQHGGVPLLQARKVGPYVDAWGAEPDPGWSFIGCMRYRSRRDMMQLATDPRFLSTHALKIAAMPNTFSFPTQVGVGAFAGPRISVALLLALCAALSQILFA